MCYIDDWFWSGLFEGFYELEFYLCFIGVSCYVKVVSVWDKSFNIIFYLMNNLGYLEVFNGGDYIVGGF